MRALLLSSLVCLSIAASGCSHTQRLIVSGNALNTIGEQFVAVAEAMDKGFQEGRISEDQFVKWVEFGTKFQQTYPAAVYLWRLSVTLQDKKIEEQVVAILGELIPQLLTFAQQVGITIEVLK